MEWEYKQVWAKRNTFEHEWYDPLEKTELGKQSPPDDLLPMAKQGQIQEGRRKQEEKAKAKAEAINEANTWLQTISGKKWNLNENNIQDLHVFVPFAEKIISAGDLDAAGRLWEQWWTIYESQNVLLRPNGWIVQSMDQMLLLQKEILLTKFLGIIDQWLKNPEHYRDGTGQWMEVTIDWGIKHRRFHLAWQVLYTGALCFYWFRFGDTIEELFLASLLEGYVENMDELKRRLLYLQKIGDEQDKKKLNKLLRDIAKKYNLSTLPREDVVLESMGKDGWECFQVSERSVDREEEQVVLYFKRPKASSTTAVTLKPSVKAFFNQ